MHQHYLKKNSLVLVINILQETPNIISIFQKDQIKQLILLFHFMHPICGITVWTTKKKQVKSILLFRKTVKQKLLNSNDELSFY